MAQLTTAGKTAKTNRPLYNQGEVPQIVQAIVPIAVATADGDTCILAYNVPVDTIVSRIMLPHGHGSVTGGTDYDIGFYKVDGADGQSLGAVIDADALVDGKSFATGVVYAFDLLGSGITLDRTQTIADLLGSGYSSEEQSHVHIVMLINTAGSAAVDLDLEIHLVPAH